MVYAVSEIYKSIQGEGTSVGKITIFVRLYGCNLNCVWCDSQYACNGNEFKRMKLSDIVRIVREMNARNCCITGGEPLLNPKVINLIFAIQKLEEIDDIIIETNGSIPLGKYIEGRDKYDKLRFVVDYKLGTSKMSDKMYKKNYEMLCEKDEVKFVIACKEDYVEAINVINAIDFRAQLLFSPVINMLEPSELVNYMCAEKKSVLDNTRVSIQIHKYIWKDNIQGV